ncbi:MAG: CHASE2 domain-containing protein [Telluria sp.]
MTENGAGAERAPSFRYQFWIFVVVGLVMAWMSDWMPLGEGAKRGLTRVWGPALTASYPTTGSEQVTVLLLDDEDLDKYAEVWPAPLGFHKRRMAELLKYRPKAIFFDFLFLDDRNDPDLDAFIDTACRARAAGTPVFIGSFGHAGRAPSRTEKAMLERRVESGAGSVPCIEPAYMNLMIDGYDQSVWEYALELNSAGSPSRPSPAARLYNVDHRAAAAPPETPMAVVWGTRVHPVNLSWMNNDLNPRGPGAPCASTWHITRMSPVTKAGAPICPYSRTLPVRALKANSGVDADDMRQAVSGKYIIYGTALQSSGDTIVSPYHGRVPGAYVHAMALDNLLSFEGKPKIGGDFLQPPASRATLFTLIAVLAISAFIAAKSAFGERLLYRGPLAARWLQPKPPRNLIPWCRWGSALACSGLSAVRRMAAWLLARFPLALAGLLLVAALILLSYFGMDLGPLVWIEYVLFPLAADFIGLGRSAETLLRDAAGSVRGMHARLPAAPVGDCAHQQGAHEAPANVES